MCPPQLGRGDKMKQDFWMKIRIGRDHRAEQTWLEEINWIYHQLNQSRIVRNKILRKTFPHSSLLHGFNFTPIFFFYLLLPSTTGEGQWIRVVISSSLFLLLLSLEVRTPHTSLPPAWGPSHRLPKPGHANPIQMSGSTVFTTLSLTFFSSNLI